MNNSQRFGNNNSSNLMQNKSHLTNSSALFRNRTIFSLILLW